MKTHAKLTGINESISKPDGSELWILPIVIAISLGLAWVFSIVIRALI